MLTSVALSRYLRIRKLVWLQSSGFTLEWVYQSKYWVYAMPHDVLFENMTTKVRYGSWCMCRRRLNGENDGLMI